MEKYFDIHVSYGAGDGDGYSIFIIAASEEDALSIAKEKERFEYPEDVDFVDYIEEIDKTEYEEATA